MLPLHFNNIVIKKIIVYKLYINFKLPESKILYIFLSNIICQLIGIKKLINTTFLFLYIKIKNEKQIKNFDIIKK